MLNTDWIINFENENTIYIVKPFTYNAPVALLGNTFRIKKHLSENIVKAVN